MQISSFRLQLFLLAISIALVACGKHGATTEASQVAAKVNGTEISVHQINQVLGRMPGVTTGNADEAGKQILERLIEQELAVTKATEAKLDRTPEVIMALDAARRDILSQAYLNQVAGAPSRVSEADVRHYFSEHPELFTQRRIFTVMDIVIARDEKLLAPLQDLIANNRSTKEIAHWLEQTGTGFTENTDTRAAENLSLAILPRIAKLKEGQSELFEAGSEIHVINLVNSKQEPVDLATAKPQIERFLATQRQQQLIADELKKLRESAKVEYLGDFAPDNSKGIAAPAVVESNTKVK